MNDLAAWLLEQIAVDEAIRAEQGETHTLQCASAIGQSWEHVCRCGFADRIQAECDAKRRIIDPHRASVPGGYCEICEGEYPPCQTLCLLALPFAGRPGYLEEWRP